MGCKTGSGNNCSGNTLSDSSCTKYSPNTGVTFTYTEYPQSPIRQGSYNVPSREANFVMYEGIETTSTSVSASNCGKITIPNPCATGQNAQNATIAFSYYPTELSFDFAFSDRFFAYLYDTSNKGGIAGTPCYYIEDESRSTVGGTADGTMGSGSTCYPCSAFTCTPQTTSLSYTCDTDYTGDPDCPHPSLFGFGSTAYKVAFSYDALSTQLPDGVVDMSLSYDGVTYTDAWNQDTLDGIPYNTAQNPWQSGDETLDDFTIYELNGSGATTGLRIKVRIRPIVDESGSSVAFTGTQWEITEILNAGTGYSVNDTFNLTYTHTHPDTTSSTLTATVKITAVAPVNQTSGSSGFDVLRTNDTINGHTITRVFHMDEQNFPYHVAYLDGSGSNFAKDTQYTSNRAHVITTVAGLGIPDRAILVGKYEFSDKSMQFVTADVDLSAPDIYNTIKQPDTTLTIENGRVTGVTINNGGTGWNQLDEEPDLIVTPPLIDSGKNAIVKGTFSAGVLTGVEIKRQGSGYDENNPPKLWIRNKYKKKVDKFTNDAYDPSFTQRNEELMSSFPKPERNKVDIGFMKALDPTTYQRLIELGISESTLNEIIRQNEATLLEGANINAPEMTAADIQSLDDSYQQVLQSDTTTTREPTVEIKLDNDRRRVSILPQRKFSSASTNELREIVEAKYNLDFLDKDSYIDSSLKKVLVEELARTQIERSASIDDITQAQIPEVSNVKESFVETVQGSFTNLPAASTGTKYFMTQYRADQTKETTINVTLSMTPVNSGCAHFTCNPPPGQTGGTVPDGNGGNTTTTYTMSGLLGPGCKAWSASGSIRMFHDLSSAATQAANANSAFGNPFDIT